MCSKQCKYNHQQKTTMNKFFKLDEKGTNFSTELLAAVTTFFTMAYIIFVNPTILSKTGMDFNSVLIATCLASAVGTLIMGLLANYPFALAPGMGLNAFFTFTVVFNMGYTWQQALAAVFISGIFFILLTISGLRKNIIMAIPEYIKHAIPAGIGLFIAFIGFNNAGIIKVNQGPVVEIINQADDFNRSELIEAIEEAPPQILELGHFDAPEILVALSGLFLIAVLTMVRVKGTLFFGIIAATLIGVPLGVTEIPQQISYENVSIQPTLLAMDFKGLFQLDNSASVFNIIIALVTILISFTIVDLFDTIGALLGTADKGGFLDKKGNLPRMNRALFSDAVATTFGAMAGTSTVTTYVESGAGIIEGGKTGLTSVIIAILFLLAIFLTPLASIVPPAATAPALIMVGLLMMSSLKNVNFQKMEEAIPAFFIITLMPFSYSIANGIAAGFIFHVVVKASQLRFKEVHPLIYIIAGLFIIHFFIV